MNAEKLAHLRRHLAARIRSLRARARDPLAHHVAQALALAMLTEARDLCRQLPRSHR